MLHLGRGYLYISALACIALVASGCLTVITIVLNGCDRWCRMAMVHEARLKK